MEGNPLRHVRAQLFPDGGDEVFDGTHLTLHEIHVQIEVAVIQLIDHIVVYDGTEFLHIVDETRIRIRTPLDGDRQLEIMPMPVLFGTAAEDFFVPFLGPFGIVQLVCCIEMLDPGQIDHDVGWIWYDAIRAAKLQQEADIKNDDRPVSEIGKS